MSQKIAFLGSSRGLGKAVFEAKPDTLLSSQFLLSSRKINAIEEFNQEQNVQLVPCDFSKTEQVDQFLITLETFAADRIFYFAGGGPYGPYGQKNYRDHEWAWQVNFLTPAKIIHWSFNKNKSKMQLIFVGSAIAESKPDHNAASYASAKHALKGLISSIQLEQPKLDLRLFSPGYMDTELLPPNAQPRRNGTSISDVKDIADKFWQWALEDDQSKHFLYL